MKKYVFLFIILVPFIGKSQLIDSISFQNFSPKWIHYSNLETLDSITNYIPFEPVFHNDALFLSHNLVDTFYEGHLTEKLHLKSGMFEWKYHYFSDEIGKREYGQSPFIDSSGNVTLLTYKEQYSNFNLPLVPKSYKAASLAVRHLNINTGEVLYEFIDEDGNGFPMYAPISTPFLYNYNLGSISPSKDGYKWFFLQGNGPILKFGYLILNSLGNIIGNDEINTIGDFFLGNVSDFKVDSSHHLTIRQFNERGTSQFRVLLSLLDDTDFVFDFEYEISNYLDHARYFDVVDAEKEYAIIHAHSDTTYKNVYYHFDSTGILKEKIAFDLSPTVKEYATACIKLDKSDKMLFFTSSVDENDIHSFSFLRSDGNGNLDTLKQIFIDNLESRYESRKIIEMENGDLLVNFAQRISLTSEKDIRKSIWMMVSKDELDVYLDMEDVLDKNDEFSISPNPSNGIINFSVPSRLTVTDVFIYNVNGKLIKRTPFQKQISLNSLNSGSYFIELKDVNGNSLGTKKVIIL